MQSPSPEKNDFDRIGLSGGVAYNDHISSGIARYLKEAGFELLMHRHVQCGDGCISFGQSLVAGLGIDSERTR
ncbi:Kae1-like domain-containing protein [Methanosarcina horonobensis]|uniref:Kae1-like domain-containing protein n=1 Tax=Methanosarcina horonobensis TaxID=418008 RepID=UPI000A9B0CFF|nr:hypothetical protein [Methanosarcina horonobensis]